MINEESIRKLGCIMLKYLNKVEKYDKWGKYQKAGLYYVKIFEQGGKI